MRRTASFTARLALLALGASAPSLIAEHAEAQAGLTPSADGRPSANRFYAAPGRGFLMVDGSDVSGELQPYANVMFDYADRPTQIDDANAWTNNELAAENDFTLVGSLATLQLTGALALANRVQIGLNLPIVLYTQGDGFEWRNSMGVGTIRGGSASGLGDPRLHLLLNIFDPDETSGFGFGVAGWATAPLAHAMMPDRYAGDPSFAFGGHLVFSFQVPHFRVALNLGGGYHQEAQIIVSRRTSEMTWGGAAQYDFDEMFGVLVEGTGATTFGLVYDNEAPTELRAAAVVRLGDFTVRAGAGFGLVYSVGVPVYRVFADLGYSPRPAFDVDGDGLADDRDVCPADAEDTDGFADDDGCPEPDNDDDGITDAQDHCPLDAEDRDEHDDEDGCPDNDDDGDGVADGYDSCPNDPEDQDGDRDTDGCPDSDRDRDGVGDDLDRCPNEPEDTDGLGDEDGCPDVDFDQDGLRDEDDECPEQAEDRDGYEDSNGCPEENTVLETAPRARHRGR